MSWIPTAERRALAVKLGASPGCGTHPAPCSYCGAPGSLLWERTPAGKPRAWVVFTHTIDHVVARANGGTHNADNLTIACGACNSSKRDRQGWNGRKVWA